MGKPILIRDEACNQDNALNLAYLTCDLSMFVLKTIINQAVDNASRLLTDRQGKGIIYVPFIHFQIPNK